MVWAIPQGIAVMAVKKLAGHPFANKSYSYFCSGMSDAVDPWAGVLKTSLPKISKTAQRSDKRQTALDRARQDLAEIYRSLLCSGKKWGNQR